MTSINFCSFFDCYTGEDRRPLSHPNPVSSSEISTESSSHRDDFEFRNSLFGHFNKLEEVAYVAVLANGAP